VGVELSGVPGIRHHNRLCRDKRAIKHQSFADSLYSSYVLASSILSSDGEITLPEYATATGEPGTQNPPNSEGILYGPLMLPNRWVS
jgi:hypothetical protein